MDEYWEQHSVIEEARYASISGSTVSTQFYNGYTDNSPVKDTRNIHDSIHDSNHRYIINYWGQ